MLQRQLALLGVPRQRAACVAHMKSAQVKTVYGVTDEVSGALQATIPARRRASSIAAQERKGAHAHAQFNAITVSCALQINPSFCRPDS